MVKMHALLFTLLTGKKCTDALNGFRAYRLSLFKDPRINIWQDWLDKYEWETYLHYKALKLGYRFKEVPVSKIYPYNRRKIKYSHIRPFIDWWSILNPLLFLSLKLKR
jgi:dolichol-phosphate mannosyltransferase